MARKYVSREGAKKHKKLATEVTEFSEKNIIQKEKNIKKMAGTVRQAHHWRGAKQNECMGREKTPGETGG